MANIDINKEGLLTIVKRITSENASLPKKFSIESIHNKSLNIIIKFLEKNNIQINEQNVLISERRKKNLLNQK